MVWANAELDKLCFGSGMSGTKLDKPSRSLDVLEAHLKTSLFLVNNEFSVADVAVASYLNYVPLFFPSVMPTARKHIVAYMKRMAERPCFEAAFGGEHQGIIADKTKLWLR